MIPWVWVESPAFFGGRKENRETSTKRVVPGRNERARKNILHTKGWYNFFGIDFNFTVK